MRQKARAGPIGIDNSEVINLEVEKEFKHKNLHVLKLNNMDVNREVEEENGFIDDEGIYHPINLDEKMFKENERLLQRLTLAVGSDGPKPLKTMNINEQSQMGGDMTANTDQIIDISSSHGGPGQGAGPSTTNPEVKELIQEKLNDEMGHPPMVSDAGQSKAAQILALQEISKRISHESWVRRKDHE